MDPDIVRAECGVTWTTRDAKGEHVHVCRRPADHQSTWHGCVEDGVTRHTIERRAALRGSGA